MSIASEPYTTSTTMRPSAERPDAQATSSTTIGTSRLVGPSDAPGTLVIEREGQGGVVKEGAAAEGPAREALRGGS